MYMLANLCICIFSFLLTVSPLIISDIPFLLTDCQISLSVRLKVMLHLDVSLTPLVCISLRLALIFHFKSSAHFKAAMIMLGATCCWTVSQTLSYLNDVRHTSDGIERLLNTVHCITRHHFPSTYVHDSSIER